MCYIYICVCASTCQAPQKYAETNQDHGLNPCSEGIETCFTGNPVFVKVTKQVPGGPWMKIFQGAPVECFTRLDGFGEGVLFGTLQELKIAIYSHW